MAFYAVIDTNVLVSALISKKEDAATVKVLNYLAEGTIIPLYNNITMAEYREVLSRKKFKFLPGMIAYVLSTIEKFGVLVNPLPSGVVLPDPTDLPFYEIALEKKKDSAFLVTGNLKHFTKEPFIVTPREMLDIISKDSHD